MSGAAWLHAYALGLAASALLAFATWLASLPKRDVSIVDCMWPLLILAPALAAVALLPAGPRAPWLLALVAAWAARLAIHIGIRNHGQPEDRRYQAIRKRNQPGFTWKSLYLVFALQAVLGWIVSMPVAAAAVADADPGWLDGAGAAIIVFGLSFESVGDWQLARFKRDPARRGQVMDQGLWRYTRHPNYFGECCVWWGAYLAALSAGAWWSVLSPLLMTVMLLKVSGVALLEKDLAQRRPAYRDYVARTSAFIPWRPTS
jgi:steroid 5-alpha reductase family enzyme